MPLNIYPTSGSRVLRFRSRRRLLVSMAVTLHLGLLFGPMPHPARAQETAPIKRVASMDTIYLYNNNGTVRDVTTTYAALGYVFDEAGNRKDIILDGIHREVFDWPDMRCVGYVVPAVNTPNL